MPAKLSAANEARIATLHRGHKTEAQIATVLAREGVQITASGVHRVLSRLGLAKPRKAAGKALGATAAPPPAPASTPDVTAGASESNADDDIADRLRRVLSSLERVAAQAEGDRDVARVVAAQRAITQAASLLAKATPAPPPSVDEHPDMKAAAKRGLENMHAAFDRLLGARS